MKDEDKDKSNAAQMVSNLGSYTVYHIDNSDAIKQAFTLGLWYSSFPDYVLLGVRRTHWWQHSKELGGETDFSDPYPNLMQFSFFSDTGDSWHQCYRDLRSKGWQRLKVRRDGGVLTYLLKNWDETKPSEFCQIHLVLSISIKTCKQVQVGTEMKEVPIMKTVCEDLAELPEDSLVSSGSVEAASAVVSQLVVVSDVEKILEDSEPDQTHSKYDFGEEPKAPAVLFPPPDEDSIPF